MKYRIGIDPGVTGAVAVLTDNEPDNKLILVFDLPLLTLSGHKQQINAVELAQHLKNFKGYAERVVYLERVAAMKGQGVTGMFNFGMGYGVIQGVVAALGMPMVLVSPSVWKRRAGLIGKDKDAARTLAQQLYPSAPLGRKRDIGRADAILIARFGGGAPGQPPDIDSLSNWVNPDGTPFKTKGI